jgi:hypothetical protein
VDIFWNGPVNAVRICGVFIVGRGEGGGGGCLGFAGFRARVLDCREVGFGLELDLVTLVDCEGFVGALGIVEGR